MSAEKTAIQGCEEQLQLLQRKLNLIEKKAILEDDPTRTLKYEVEKEETELKIAEVKKRLAELIAEEATPVNPIEQKDRIALNEHHKYTCDRKPQDVQFHKLFKAAKDNSNAHFFYLYGLDVQSHEGIFNRFAYALEGRLMDYKYENFESEVQSIKVVLTPSLAQDEEYDRLQVLNHLFAGLNVAHDQFEPLLEKDLAYLYENSPVVNELGKEDYVCVMLAISSYDWDAELTPALARWFILKFCECKLPQDAPTFIFFMGIVFEEEDEDIQNEVKETVENSELIFGIPELKSVKLTDIKKWFREYNFIRKTKTERDDLIKTRFGDATEFDMQDIEIRLLKIIDEYNAGKI
jgi:hypothetical protein